MTFGRRFAVTITLLGAAIVGGVADPAHSAEPEARPAVRIGVPKSMFRDIPPDRFQALAFPFNLVVQEQTGLKGQLILTDTPDDLRQKLADGCVQLGVFHGFEFAWMKLKDHNLQPLMLVAATPTVLQPVVVVKQDNPAKSICDCRGQRLAVPVGCREHSRLFLHRQCRHQGASVQEFFPVTKTPESILDALDELYEGKVDVVMIDQAALKTYGDCRPARRNELRPLQQSEPFPASVIAYSRGGVDNSTLEKFRSGMATANKSTIGRKLMLAMRITGFESVPANYDQSLADIVKRYPPNEPR